MPRTPRSRRRSSAARWPVGLADAASDIELDVYWSSPPTAADREAAIEGAGLTRVYAEEDDHEWADGLLVGGVKTDVSGFVTSTIDTYLDRVLAGDTDAELQVRVTALRDGIPLHGHDGHRRVARRAATSTRRRWPSPRCSRPST